MAIKSKEYLPIHENPIIIDSEPSKSNDTDPAIAITITEQNPTVPPITHYPVFTVVIGLIDVFMLLLIYVVQEGTTLTPDTWIKMGCKYVPCMKPLYSKVEQDLYNTDLKSQCEAFILPYQFLRFVTPIFLHGSIMHLLSNLACQALAGALLEGKYGTKTLAFCYILFGCSGNIMSALCNPKSISVGASGAVHGLLFFCIIDNALQIFGNDDSRDILFQYVITCLVIPCLVMSILFDVDISGRTDHAAHIGGVIMGILVAIYLCPIPESLLRRIAFDKESIRLLVFIFILTYFLITLLIFYLFIPVYLK